MTKERNTSQVFVTDGFAFFFSDLAARNCLVFPDLSVKIGDYGISRCVYKVCKYLPLSKPSQFFFSCPVEFTLLSHVLCFGCLALVMSSEMLVPLSLLGFKSAVYKYNWKISYTRYRCIKFCVTPLKFRLLYKLFQNDYYNRPNAPNTIPIRWLAPEGVVIQQDGSLVTKPASSPGNVW